MRAIHTEQAPKSWVLMLMKVLVMKACAAGPQLYQTPTGPKTHLDQARALCQVKAKANAKITAKLVTVSELMFVKCHRSLTFFSHLAILWHKKKVKQRAAFTSAPLKTQGTKSVPDMWGGIKHH